MRILGPDESPFAFATRASVSRPFLPSYVSNLILQRCYARSLLLNNVATAGELATAADASSRKRCRSLCFSVRMRHLGLRPQRGNQTAIARSRGAPTSRRSLSPTGRVATKISPLLQTSMGDAFPLDALSRLRRDLTCRSNEFNRLPSPTTRVEPTPRQSRAFLLSRTRREPSRCPASRCACRAFAT